MKKAGFQNSKYFIFFSVILLLFGSCLRAQDKKTSADIEKIYLHTDRTRYFIGDDLWYKAYDVRASNNLLFDNSNILYVELIAPNSQLIARNKTNIEMGLGYGDFQLADSLGIKPGVYQLRAYTNWNRNFGEDFVFKKNIEVLDVYEMHAQPDKSKAKSAANVGTARKKVVSQPEAGAQDNGFQIDFFPEGGSLVENVVSSIGFKAVDSSGNPAEVSGQIFNSDDESVTSFESVYDGMGKLQLLPLEGKKYYAKIKTKSGVEIKKELPSVSKFGYVMGYRVFRGRNIITISSNTATLVQNPAAVLRVKCQGKGISYLEITQTLTENSFSFELPKEQTPDGISQITLFDAQNRPQSERLVFIEKEHDLEVQLTTDKNIYQPNEKAIVNVSSKSKTGALKSASYSLSVTDLNGVEDNDFESTISSYFLMESDIRGKVHHPAYYFDLTNPKRLEHLDNLLLTQGWRDFIWKSNPVLNNIQSYKVEKGITISGRVKQLFGDKPKSNLNMTLALINKKRRNFFSAITDETGSFKFESMMFSGQTKMFLNSANEKGKFKGEILLDTIEQQPLEVFFKDELSSWSEKTRIVAENVFKKNVAFGVKPENILDEVTIMAKKKSTSRSYFGIPENSYIADEDAKNYSTIYELIVQKIPGVILSDDTVRFFRNSEPPLFVLNGNTAFKEEIDVLLPQDVEKIEVIKGQQAEVFFGNEAANGFIAIYTKPNTGNRSKETLNSIQKEIDGFYIARNFYSPIPNDPQQEINNSLAVRNTLYWSPYVHPDKSGEATVSYFNTKVETKVKVALEGITAGGIPVVRKVYYTIKK